MNARRIVQEETARQFLRRRTKPMDFYIILHVHRHGTSRWLVRCGHEPTIAEIVDALAIDFEPDCDESVEIEHIPSNDIVTIP